MKHFPYANEISINKAEILKTNEGRFLEAAKVGSLVIVEFHIQSGVNINAKDGNGNTALHLAAQAGKLDVVEFLLKNNAAFEVKNNKGETPLDLAKAAEETTSEKTPLDKAKKAELTKVAKHLEQWIKRPHAVKEISTEDKKESFIAAVKRNNLQAIKELLDTSIDVNITDPFGKTPLHIAVDNENYDIAELLIKAGAEVSANDLFNESALHIAVEKGNLPLVQLLVKNKASVNTTRQLGQKTPLHIAIEKKQEAIVEFLLENGTDVNIPYHAIQADIPTTDLIRSHFPKLIPTIEAQQLIKTSQVVQPFIISPLLLGLFGCACLGFLIPGALTMAGIIAAMSATIALAATIGGAVGLGISLLAGFYFAMQKIKYNKALGQQEQTSTKSSKPTSTTHPEQELTTSSDGNPSFGVLATTRAKEEQGDRKQQNNNAPSLGNIDVKSGDSTQ